MMNKFLTLIHIEKKLKDNVELTDDDVKFLLDNLNANKQVKIDYAYYLVKKNKREEASTLIDDVLPLLHGKKLYSICHFLLFNGSEETFLKALDMSVKEGNREALKLDKFLKDHYSQEDIESGDVEWRLELIKFTEGYPGPLVN